MSKKGILFALTTALISGVSIYMNKFGVKVGDPYIFTGLKNMTVVIFLLALIFLTFRGKDFKKLRGKDWRALVMIGLVGGGIPFLLFFKGLSLTTAASGAFIHKSMFLFVVLLAYFFLKERINKSFFLGILALFLGNLLLLKITPQPWGRGDFLILLAVLFWAGEQILSKKALKNLSPHMVAWGRMFFGSLVILGFWLVTGRISLLASVNSLQLSWILITSVFLFGYVVFWYSALKRLPASVAASFLVLGGVVTAVLSLVFDHKLWSREEIWGTLLILVGVILIVGLKKVKNLVAHVRYQN